MILLPLSKGRLKKCDDQSTLTPLIFMKRLFVSGILLSCMAVLAYAGPADIRPTPLLNLQAGISDELIVSIRKGETKIDELITVFSEDEQKNLPVRIEQKFTPLCAAASGRNVKAIKQLIELGANVNGMCINMGIITNPLELAYRVMGQQETENEASQLLKSNGAAISDDWVESYQLQKMLKQRMDEYASKIAAENAKILGNIFLQIALNAVSQKILFSSFGDVNQLSGDLISTTLDVAKERESQEIEVVALNEKTAAFVDKTPFTHSTRQYFAELKAGQAWCSSYLPAEQLIFVINSLNATLVKMNRCSCAKSTAVAMLPFVCGIPYAYKPKKSSVVSN
jgi:hypothetical protein